MDPNGRRMDALSYKNFMDGHENFVSKISLVYHPKTWPSQDGLSTILVRRYGTAILNFLFENFDYYNE